jgi:hypothetical protein
MGERPPYVMRMYVRLTAEEREALCRWAEEDRRHPADLAALLIANALREREARRQRNDERDGEGESNP